MGALLQAFLFGVTLAIAVGPIALLIVNTAAGAGMGRGLRWAAGASAADWTFAVIAFVGGYALAPWLRTAPASPPSV